MRLMIEPNVIWVYILALALWMIFLGIRITTLGMQIAELKAMIRITRSEANLPPVKFIGEPE